MRYISFFCVQFEAVIAHSLSVNYQRGGISVPDIQIFILTDDDDDDDDAEGNGERGSFKV